MSLAARLDRHRDPKLALKTEKVKELQYRYLLELKTQDWLEHGCMEDAQQSRANIESLSRSCYPTILFNSDCTLVSLC